MSTNRTFTMIKPDAVGENNTGAIIKMIEEAGFRIVALKKTLLTPERAGEFYAVHQERPFYGDLCKYMSSGAIVPVSYTHLDVYKRQPPAWCFRAGTNPCPS